MDPLIREFLMGRGSLERIFPLFGLSRVQISDIMQAMLVGGTLAEGEEEVDWVTLMSEATTATTMGWYGVDSNINTINDEMSVPTFRFSSTDTGSMPYIPF
jgi:hypothetical protein